MSTLFDHDGQHDPMYDHMRRRLQQVDGAMQRFENMWREYEPYCDPNFKTEFVLHPCERFWEMLLTVALLDAGFELTAPKPGPDICLPAEHRTVWIEAVAPTAGSGPDEVPDPPANTTFDYPEDKIILRFRAAIEEKCKKRCAYVDHGIIDEADPYVIAISGGQMPLLIDMTDAPAILKAVFPLGAPQIRVELNTGRTEDGGYAHRPHVSKANQAPVSTTCFLHPDYSGISAVLFSEANFLVGPADARKEFLVIHNPCAKAPLPKGWLGFGREFYPSPEGDFITGRIESL